MFGYIKICKPEMRVREFETYKAVYCSLCRELGRSYGLLARFTLNYDFTFLTVLRLSMEQDHPEFIRKRCAFNPLKKCKCCKRCGSLAFSAAAAVIMLYYKVCDDLYDHGFFKKAAAGFIRPLFARARKKAAKQFPEIEKTVAAAIARQRDVESRNSAGIDEASEPTAKLLSELFSLDVADQEQKRVLEQLGFCMGKWVYLADASDDLASDLKRGNFNPLANGLALKAGDNVFPPKRKDIEKAKERAAAVMNTCVHEAALALELLPVKRFEEILRNVIIYGMDRPIFD